MAATMLVVGLLGACARPGPAPGGDGGGLSPGGDGGGSSPSPSGDPRVVASLRVGGGFVPYAWHLMEGPRLVVYSDGQAVADTSRTLVLSADELSDLVRALRTDLGGLGPTASAGAEQQIADAPTTTLSVRTDDLRLYTVSAYALGETTGYPRRLVAARDRLESLARRVLADGTAFTSDRIRLVVDPRESAEGAVGVWPASVPVPPPAAEPGLGVRTADLTGPAAAEAANALPGDSWRSRPWPVLRTADGTLYSVAWRYLVPEE